MNKEEEMIVPVRQIKPLALAKITPPEFAQIGGELPLSFGEILGIPDLATHFKVRTESGVCSFASGPREVEIFMNGAVFVSLPPHVCGVAVRQDKRFGPVAAFYRLKENRLYPQDMRVVREIGIDAEKIPTTHFVCQSCGAAEAFRGKVPVIAFTCRECDRENRGTKIAYPSGVIVHLLG